MARKNAKAEGGAAVLELPKGTAANRLKVISVPILKIKQVGTFVNRYDNLSRPCEPISLTVVGIDQPGRAERLQSIVDLTIEEHDWIKQLPKRNKEWIDLDFDRRAEEDWVAA